MHFGGGGDEGNGDGDVTGSGDGGGGGDGSSSGGCKVGGEGGPSGGGAGEGAHSDTVPALADYTAVVELLRDAGGVESSELVSTRHRSHRRTPSKAAGAGKGGRASHEVPSGDAADDDSAARRAPSDGAAGARAPGGP